MKKKRYFSRRRKNLRKIKFNSENRVTAMMMDNKSIRFDVTGIGASSVWPSLKIYEMPNKWSDLLPLHCAQKIYRTYKIKSILFVMDQISYRQYRVTATLDENGLPVKSVIDDQISDWEPVAVNMPTDRYIQWAFYNEPLTYGNIYKNVHQTKLPNGKILLRLYPKAKDYIPVASLGLTLKKQLEAMNADKLSLDKMLSFCVPPDVLPDASDMWIYRFLINQRSRIYVRFQFRDRLITV